MRSLTYLTVAALELVVALEVVAVLELVAALELLGSRSGWEDHMDGYGGGMRS